MQETKYAISKPVVIIASRADVDFSRHQKLFRRNGMECLQITDRFKLIEESIKPSCFCVFMDDNFCRDSTTVMAEIKKHSKAAWIFCLRDQFGKLISHQAMAAGASLVLFRPTDPEQYLLRAKQMLSIFESKMDKPFSQAAGTRSESVRVASVPNGIPSMPKAPQAVAVQSVPMKVTQKASKSEIKSEGTQSASPKLPKLTDEIRVRLQGVFKNVSQKADYARRHPQWDQLAEHYVRRPFENLDILRKNHAALMDKVISEVGAGNLELISFRVDSPTDSNFRRVRVLATNRFDMNFSPSLPIEQFPELRYCLDQRMPVFVVNASDVAQLLGCPHKVDEVGVAALPILDSQQSILGVVRVSFPVPIGLDLQSFLADLAAYASKLDVGFRTLEFFSRIYSDDCKLYARGAMPAHV